MVSYTILCSHWNKETPLKVEWPSEQCLNAYSPAKFYMLFPRPWWQTGRLLKVIGVLPLGPLKPRWWPGHIPKWSCCSRPQKRQAHWGAMLLSPWRWGDRLASAQTHTFMVSSSVSLRRFLWLTAVAHKIWFPLLPEQDHSPSIRLFKASAGIVWDIPSLINWPSLPWQRYPCEAWWEQLWDVRLDLQVWAGPKRGLNVLGLPTPSMAHAPLWFYLRVWKYHSQMLSPLSSSHNWLLMKTGLTSSVKHPWWSIISLLSKATASDRHLKST